MPTGTPTQASWPQLLHSHGWTLVAGDGQTDGSRWRHPTATGAFSATITHGCLFVYSPNTPFDVTYPSEPHGYTPFRALAILEHHGDLSATAKALRASRPDHITSTLPPHIDKTTTNGDTPTGRRIVLTPASSIAPKRVRWTWDERIAAGTIALLAGREGLGKSTLGYWMAARLTRGELPGEYEGTPRTALVCTTEDSWAHTVVPRLMAHDADLDLVYRTEVRYADEDINLGLSLPDDIDELRDAATNNDVALLVLDPLMSRLSDKFDTHIDAEVRRALEPLVSVAEDTRMAVLGLIHHNKSGSSDPLQLVMASKAFAAVARSVHTCIPDPDDDTQQRRLFGTSKNNLGRMGLPTLTFTMQTFTYPTDEEDGTTGQIVWGEELTESIADALARASQGPEERTALEEACEWLSDYLEEHHGRCSRRSTTSRRPGLRTQRTHDP